MPTRTRRSPGRCSAPGTAPTASPLPGWGASRTPTRSAPRPRRSSPSARPAERTALRANRSPEPIGTGWDNDPLMGGEMREERRVVTAMFADLVGSTALAERLDPEDAKVIVNDAVTRAIAAVEAFGGPVKY